MSLKTMLVQTVMGPCNYKVVKFSEDMELTISATPSGNNAWDYYVSNVKGNFEIVKMEYKDNYPNRPSMMGAKPTYLSSMLSARLPNYANQKTVLFNSVTKKFETKCEVFPEIIDIYILAETDFKTVVSITKLLEIPQARFEYLEPNQMFIDYLVLSNPDGKNVSYKYYGKRINNETIEVHIENPESQGVKLNGKKGDFHYTTKLQNICMMLSFIFELSESEDHQTSVACESRPVSFSEDDVEKNDKIEAIFQSKSTPLSVILEAVSLIKTSRKNLCPSNCKCYKMSPIYHKITLVASNESQWWCHHSTLTKNSLKISKIFDASTSYPITILMKNSTAETIKAALDFLNNENPNANLGKEADLFFFADEWNIPSLMDATRHAVDTFLKPSNVCELIQIAFDENLEETKKICKKFILENKAKIDSAKLEKLSQEIVLYVFCF